MGISSGAAAAAGDAYLLRLRPRPRHAGSDRVRGAGVGQRAERADHPDHRSEEPDEGRDRGDGGGRRDRVLYGLAQRFDLSQDRIDVYATDHAYWAMFDYGHNRGTQ